MTVSLSLNDDLERASHATHATMEHDAEAANEAPTLEPESNYISPGELMLWLATKSDGMYGELRQAMQMSEDRSELARAVKDLQTLMEEDGVSGQERRAAVDALLTQVKGTEFEAEVTAMLEPMRQTLFNPELEFASDEMYQASIDGERNLWGKKLESFASELDHQDKLALITIQQLVGEIRDATQLASNLVASEHDATSGVIGNIRA